MKHKFVAALLVLMLGTSTMLYAQDAPLLTESDIKPCEGLLTKSLAIEIENTKKAIQDYGPGGKGRNSRAESTSDSRLEYAKKKLGEIGSLSILQYALQSPPYSPLYDERGTLMFIKVQQEAIAILQSGDEEKMHQVIGKVYQGQELQDNITGRNEFLCMLNVRLAQIKADPKYVQRELPKITADDLAACNKEIADLHREEINYLKIGVEKYCSDPGSRNCENAKEWVSDSSSQSNLAWFMKGSTSCADGYVCYGLSTYNENPDERFINTILETPYWADVEATRAALRELNPGTHSKHDEFYFEKNSLQETILAALSLAADKCIAKIWIAKRDGKTPAAAAGKQPAKKAAGNSMPANDGSSTPPVVGTVLMDRPGEPMPSSASRPSSKKEKRRNVPDAVATKCLTVDNKPGFGGFINSCDYSVEYYYCAYRPKKGAWTESFDCEKEKFGSWIVGAKKRDASHTKNAEMIHWVACRYRGPDGKPLGISPLDVKWDAQKKNVTFRCGEWGS